MYNVGNKISTHAVLFEYFPKKHISVKYVDEFQNLVVKRLLQDIKCFVEPAS